MTALVRKELHELAGIAAVALALYLAEVVNLLGGRLFDWVPAMPRGTGEVPFTGEEFLQFFTLVSVLFALALGFRQSAWESGRGTYLFLLHRPVPRTAVFAIKLATGAGLLLACSALPIVLYGLWCSVPGHVPAPFEWSMTAPAWQMTLLMPVLYFGAFLSGLRPARWFGTRLFPLAACGLAVVTLLAAVPRWWPVGFLCTALLCALLTANVVFVARKRDFS